MNILWNGNRKKYSHLKNAFAIWNDANTNVNSGNWIILAFIENDEENYTWIIDYMYTDKTNEIPSGAIKSNIDNRSIGMAQSVRRHVKIT